MTNDKLWLNIILTAILHFAYCILHFYKPDIEHCALKKSVDKQAEIRYYEIEVKKMIWIWMAVIAISLFYEIYTVQFVGLWFVAGAIAALILETLNVHFAYQILAFVVISLAFLILLRSICLKYFNKRTGKTNMDLIIGKKVLLIKPITEHENGAVKINGVVWTACGAEGFLGKADAEVEIVGVEGNRLIVKGV